MEALPLSLKHLYAHGCVSLESVFLSPNHSIKHFDLGHCPRLNQEEHEHLMDLFLDDGNSQEVSSGYFLDIMNVFPFFVGFTEMCLLTGNWNVQPYWWWSPREIYNNQPTSKLGYQSCKLFPVPLFILFKPEPRFFSSSKLKSDITHQIFCFSKNYQKIICLFITLNKSLDRAMLYSTNFTRLCLYLCMRFHETCASLV